MQKSQKNRFRVWAIRLALVLFDVFTVNFSYFIALVIRFYVNSEFHGLAAPHIAHFMRFAPVYTLLCIPVFAFFKLYNGLWRYAGLGDINRIIYANVCTCAIQVFGSILVLGQRMPITYYVIGAAIQFALILVSRFAPRLFAEELSRYAKVKNTATINTMIIGAGESARIFLRLLDSDKDNLLHPVCIINSRSNEQGQFLNGIPVVGGQSELRDALKKYSVKCVVLADPLMPTETRREIRKECDQSGIDLRVFSGYSSFTASGLSLHQLLEHADCPVTVLSGGRAQSYDNPEAALLANAGKQEVKSIGIRDGRLFVELVTYQVEPLTLFYITNRPDVALTAEKYGVDRIWIDLETIGKEERQKNMNTVKSRHTVADVAAIKPLLTKSELLVRVNPWYEGSQAEIDAVIAGGADIIMLPYWKTVEEVDNFLRAVNGRCRTTLLLETKEAVECVDEILKRRFDEIHIGLNDLSISYGTTFMFELLANGTVEMLCDKFRKAGIPYGFGGIAKLGDGLLPAERIIMEHYRLGSTRAILSRTFCDQAKLESIEEIDRVFRDNMEELKEYELSMADVSQEEFIRNKMEIVKAVDEIVAQIKRARSNEI